MSEQGWLKREMEVVQCEVATWPAWKRGEGMKDAKRYKLCQDVCYDDGAFVIPAGQVMVREADYDDLRDERDRLRATIRTLCSSGNRLLDDLIGRSDAAESFKYHIKQAQAALTPAGGGKNEK